MLEMFFRHSVITLSSRRLY